jgi:hypothetical protein
MFMQNKRASFGIPPGAKTALPFILQFLDRAFSVIYMPLVLNFLPSDVYFRILPPLVLDISLSCA